MSRLGVWCLLLAFAAHVLVTTVGAGLVVCFEADGRVVIEAATGDRCGDQPASSSDSRTGLSAAGDCDSCVDVPLPHTMASSHQGPSRIVIAGLDTAASAFTVVPPSSSIGTARATAARTIDLSSNRPTAFLRSVVILC